MYVHIKLIYIKMKVYHLKLSSKLTLPNSQLYDKHVTTLYSLWNKILLSS